MAEKSESGMHWPLGIAAGLLLVVVVNVVFAWYAVTHPSEIVSSYETETR